MAFSWRNLFGRKQAVTPTQAKGLTIVDDGFIPREITTYADLLTGRGRVEEGLDSDVIMAPVAWIMRTFPDAVARVEQRKGDTWEWVERHDVQRLIKRPNPGYNGDALWQATSLSYVLNGNAYWQKVRNRFGRVVQLWYRPHWSIKPYTQPGSSDFITHYDYDTGRGIEPLNVRDVVHFRFGVDPRDARLGFGPLRPLLREMLTDMEAARFSIRILENMGIPGVVVSPTVSPTGDAFEPDRSEIDALKEYINTSFTGSGRGSTLVFGQPTTVTQFGFDPSKLTLSDLRDGAEERVCAMLGLPASVVGFGSGMDQTKIGAVMEQQVKLAWKQCLFPMQRSLARQLDEQLLADFVPDYEDRQRIAFDLSDAVSLKEDATSLSERVCREVEAGVLRVDKAQAMLGYEVDQTQKVYLRKITVMPVPAEEVPEPVVHPQDARMAEADAAAAEQAEAESGAKADVIALFTAKVLERMHGAKPEPVEAKAEEIVAPDLAPIVAEMSENGNGHHTEGHTDVAA